MTLLAIGITRFTWPIFARAPFFPLFGAVYVTSRWGSERAGFVAVALGAIGAMLALPQFDPGAFRIIGVPVYVLVAAIAAHLAGERNQFIQALQASEAQFRTTWEHAALGAALLSRAGRVERINPAMERILGHPSAAWLDRPLDHFSHPDDASAERERFERLIKGTEPPYQSEQRYRRGDGSWVWCRVTVSAVRGRDGLTTGALMAVEDVTARRQAEADLRASEERLRRAQKMEAVGQLVAGVAHNFNNLLTITMGYTDLLLERPREGDAPRVELEEIRKATLRGATLTRQLLAFSRSKPTQPTRLDLNRVVAELRDILTRVIQEDIRLAIRLAPGVVGICIDPHDLEQAILNLVLNARDAMRAGGTIQIEIEKQRIDANSPPDLSIPPGEYARLRIRDDGPGMTPEVQRHLFEPFFTTKDVGEGTGLGLAFVYGVVRQHQGFITCDTAPGKGATFDLYFPLTQGVEVEAAPVVVETRRPDGRRGATVLIVEDEDAVRAVTALTLTQAGYRVLEAGSPSEAGVLFDRHVNDIDLLVSDVVMPEMHGPVLASRLVERRPDLPVLFMSGYSDAMPDLQGAGGRVAFLGKPFAPSLLVSTVGELLSAPRQT